MTTAATSTNSTNNASNIYATINAGSANSSTGGSSVSSAASLAAASQAMQLNQSDFLKLMTTQMTHQDPNQPMQNGEFLSEMAQFGTVSGIQDLQNSFASLATSMTSDQSLQAASLVGKYVSVPSSQGVLSAGGDIAGTATLASSTSDLQVTVSDATTGVAIKTIDLGTQSQGNVPFTWDGTNTAGTMASPGIYKIQASANINGTNTMLPTNINMLVNSVTMANGTTPLTVNLADSSSVPFSKVVQIL